MQWNIDLKPIRVAVPDYKSVKEAVEGLSYFKILFYNSTTYSS